MIKIISKGKINNYINKIIFNFEGFTLGLGSEKGKVKLGWTFILKLKKDNIKSIKIYDVTDEEKILIEDTKISLKEGKWVGKSESVEIEKGSNHWLFSSDDTEKEFKVIMTDSNEVNLHRKN